MFYHTLRLHFVFCSISFMTYSFVACDFSILHVFSAGHSWGNGAQQQRQQQLC